MDTSDELLQQNIIDELQADDELESSTIGVAVKHGVVHLVGAVPTQADRDDALAACLRVAKAANVVNDLRVERTTTI